MKSMYRFAPRIVTDCLPEEERPYADLIIRLLHRMEHLISEFRSSAKLFEHCVRVAGEASDQYWKSRTDENSFGDPALQSESDAMNHWPMIPARICAMIVYHFGKVKHGLDLAISRCPELNSLLDRDLKREGSRLFSASFPHNDLLRHAISHREETSNTLDAEQKHTIVLDEGSTALFSDVLMENVYSSTWNGQMFSCAIDEETVGILTVVLDCYFGAFMPAEKETMRRLMERQTPPAAPDGEVA